MIVLDTHAWLWWVNGDDKLSGPQNAAIEASASSGIVVSSISLWEIAIKAAAGKLVLDRELLTWLQRAQMYPGVRIASLSAEIVVESTRLPGPFHRDPADRMIVATARVMNCPLVTSDAKIIGYPHVSCVS